MRTVHLLHSESATRHTSLPEQRRCIWRHRQTGAAKVGASLRGGARHHVEGSPHTGRTSMTPCFCWTTFCASVGPNTANSCNQPHPALQLCDLRNVCCHRCMCSSTSVACYMRPHPQHMQPCTACMPTYVHNRTAMMHGMGLNNALPFLQQRLCACRVHGCISCRAFLDNAGPPARSASNTTIPVPRPRSTDACIVYRANE